MAVIALHDRSTCCNTHLHWQLQGGQWQQQLEVWVMQTNHDRDLYIGNLRVFRGNWKTLASLSQTITSFLREFGGEVDVSEAAEPVESYRTFNEFFYRKLKPGARPIAHPEQGAFHVPVAHKQTRLLGRRGY